jgi:hypothetical protein
MCSHILGWTYNYVFSHFLVFCPSAKIGRPNKMKETKASQHAQPWIRVTPSRERVRKDSRRVGSKRKSWEKVRNISEGERASFC